MFLLTWTLIYNEFNCFNHIITSTRTYEHINPPMLQQLHSSRSFATDLRKVLCLRIVCWMVYSNEGLPDWFN